MDLTMLYLSHEDFQRLMRWILLRDTEGDFKEHIARYNRNIVNADVLQDWKAKKQFILDKGNFIKEYFQCYLWETKICVDTLTGVVYTPETSNL